MKVDVVNIRYKAAVKTIKYIYIGRPPRAQRAGGHYGNPFSHLTSSTKTIWVSSRTEAVNSFRDWLDGKAHHDVEPARRLWILAALLELAKKGEDVTFGCFCKPQECHGDILAQRLLDIRARFSK
jgi:hypothetical protein